MKHEIAKQLMEVFNAEYVSVTDDSQAHAGHRGTDKVGDSHFTVTIVSGLFEGKSRVARHQWVYRELDACFQKGLHALAITAKTPEEMGHGK